MEKEFTLEEKDYINELVSIIRSNISPKDLLDKLDNYHDNDIAGALEELSVEERQKLYPILGTDRLSAIFTYIEEPEKYLKETSIETTAEVISNMDSDDAVDIIEELDDSTKKKLADLVDEEAKEDIKLILSYEDDEIGSIMTTNYIVIKTNLSIKEAKEELIKQAEENDNISTIYVTREDDTYCGAIDLKDLIIAKESNLLIDLILTSYPYVNDHDKVSECIDRIREYSEDSIPVITEKGLIVGVITPHDIVDVVDDEMSDDYVKLAGLTAEEDLKETLKDSMKKRLPWLIALLFLGMIVSSVVGVFEAVVAVLPIVICFQSMILDMAGNVGTQSLAVTIRVLMDENVDTPEKIKLIFKEIKVGFANGLFLGILAFIFVGLYIHFLKGNSLSDSFTISGCVGISLLATMIVSSLVGTIIPMFFHKIKVDPAVASGPLITTVNDLVAVVIYYGLSWVLLINLLHKG